MENNKSAEAGSNPALDAATGQTMTSNGGANPDSPTIPIPKLGMAPLSSELAVAAASNNTSAEILQPPNKPSPDPPQPADPGNIRTPMPPTIDTSRPDPTPTNPTQLPTIPAPSEPEQAPQTSEPLPPLPDTNAPPPDPTPTINEGEQSQLPGPNPTPSSPPSTTDVDLHPPNVDSASKEIN